MGGRDIVVFFSLFSFLFCTPRTHFVLLVTFLGVGLGCFSMVWCYSKRLTLEDKLLSSCPGCPRKRCELSPFFEVKNQLLPGTTTIT